MAVIFVLVVSCIFTDRRNGLAHPVRYMCVFRVLLADDVL